MTDADASYIFHHSNAMKLFEQLDPKDLTVAREVARLYHHLISKSKFESKFKIIQVLYDELVYIF